MSEDILVYLKYTVDQLNTTTEATDALIQRFDRLIKANSKDKGTALQIVMREEILYQPCIETNKTSSLRQREQENPAGLRQEMGHESFRQIDTIEFHTIPITVLG